MNREVYLWRSGPCNTAAPTVEISDDGLKIFMYTRI